MYIINFVDQVNGTVFERLQFLKYVDEVDSSQRILAPKFSCDWLKCFLLEDVTVFHTLKFIIAHESVRSDELARWGTSVRIRL